MVAMWKDQWRALDQEWQQEDKVRDLKVANGWKPGQKRVSDCHCRSRITNLLFRNIWNSLTRRQLLERVLLQSSHALAVNIRKTVRQNANRRAVNGRNTNTGRNKWTGKLLFSGLKLRMLLLAQASHGNHVKSCERCRRWILSIFHGSLSRLSVVGLTRVRRARVFRSGVIWWWRELKWGIHRTAHQLERGYWCVVLFILLCYQCTDNCCLVGIISWYLWEDQSAPGGITWEWGTSGSSDYSWDHGCIHQAWCTPYLWPHHSWQKSIQMLWIIHAKISTHTRMERVMFHEGCTKATSQLSADSVWLVPVPSFHHPWSWHTCGALCQHRSDSDTLSDGWKANME